MVFSETRRARRTDVCKIETVSIYRDSQDPTYEAMFRTIDDPRSPYSLFNVVALLRDVSQKGFGIRFEGQQVLAGILLRPGDSYILKLTLLSPAIREDMKSYFYEDGNYHFLLVKGVCRWRQQEEQRSRAGFELTGVNAPQILQFIRDYFSLD